MKRTFTLIISALAATALVSADDYVTPAGAGQVTMATLAADSNSGVADNGDGIYVMNNDVTVTADNTFSLDGAKVIKMADGVALTLQCYASFDGGDSRTLVTRAAEADAPKGIKVDYEGDQLITFSHIDFEYAALKNLSPKGFDVSDCTFRYANGALSSAGALNVGSDGAIFNIKGCTFEYNTVPAIGGAANYFCGLLIEDCVFTDNNTSNTNKPQLNLTVGGDKSVVVRNCTLTGSGRNMVGGIAVGNLMCVANDNNVVIEGCDISEHRYGITCIGPMSALIRDNNIVNNNHETNAMNGGSGISLSGYGYELNAIVSGNHIENSLWGITIINCNDVNLGQIDNPDSPGNNVFVNNGNNGVQYDLYNNQAKTVYAQNNTWSVAEQTAELIETVIFHNADNPQLGEVIFMPAHTSNGIISAQAQDFAVTAGKIVSNECVSVYNAAGICVIRDVMMPDISVLPSGVYVAVSAGKSIKFVR